MIRYIIALQYNACTGHNFLRLDLQAELDERVQQLHSEAVNLEQSYEEKSQEVSRLLGEVQEAQEKQRQETEQKVILTVM